MGVFRLVGLPLISLIKSTALDSVVTVVLVGNGARWGVTGFVPRSRSQWSNLALGMSSVIAVVLDVSIPGLAIGVVMGVIVGGAFLVSAVASRRAWRTAGFYCASRCSPPFASLLRPCSSAPNSLSSGLHVITRRFQTSGSTAR